MASIYFVQAARLRLVKIGLALNPVERVCELQVGSPDLLNLLGSIRCEDQRAAAAYERELHRRFAEDRLHGEWFSPSEAIMEFIATEVAAACESEHERLYLRAIATAHTRRGRAKVHYAERRRRELAAATEAALAG